MAFTQVCHRWRVIALSTEALWSFISLGSPNHVPAFYIAPVGSWSRWLPVDLSRPIFERDGETASVVRHSRPVVADSLELIPMRRSQVKAITLLLPNVMVEDVLRDPGRGGVAAPSLQSLTLYNNVRSQLPNIFSLHHLPALKHLVHHHYQFSWPQSLFQFNTLETLIIRHTPRSHVP